MKGGSIVYRVTTTDNDSGMVLPFCLTTDAARYFEGRHDRSGVCAPHSHDDWELVLLLEGAFEDVRRGTTVHLTSPSLIGLPAGETHAPRFEKGAKWFEIRIQSRWLERSQGCSRFIETAVASNGGVPVWIAQRLHQEFRFRDELSPMMMEGLLLELLVESSRRISLSSESCLPTWLARARDYLHDGFRENMTLTEIAEAASVHPSHLARAFRRHFLCTPGDYVRRLRVEYAEQLLAKGEMPLSEIALEAGFSHQSHFCRLFKEQTGLSPAQFQQLRNSRASLRQ